MKLNLDWAKQPPTRKQLLLGGGHLAALWAITFVQPLLDILGKNADFFVARGNTAGDVLILSIGFMFVPPLILLAIETVARLIGPRVYYATHFFFFLGIATFLFIQIGANFFSKPTILLVLMALILGTLLAYAVFRVVFLKNLMDILIVAPVVILLLFIFASDANKVIFPAEEEVSIGASTESTTPVVWIIFDELGNSTLMTKQGEIDRQRFPNFATMEDESTWYKNQSTTSYFTPTAVPGLLTGNIPAEDALPTAADQPNNIFSLLSDSYDFHVREPITSICPASICPAGDESGSQKSRLKLLFEDLKYVEGRLVLPPRIADTLPDVGSNFENFGEGEGGDGDKSDGGKDKGEKGKKQANSSFDDLLSKVRGKTKKKTAKFSKSINDIPTGNSHLTMLHILQPHQPWKYNTKGLRYNRSPIDQLSEGTDAWLVDRNGVASAQQRHLVQTGFADDLLGQVITRLKKFDAWDKTMVIVAADHGVSFQGNGIPKRRAGTESMGEVANPPLFIKYPGQKTGKVNPIHSMTIDVVPTIAEELDVQGMYKTDGVPLQSGDVPEREVTVKDVQNNKFSLSIDEVLKQRTAGIAEKDLRFGTGPLYTLGPVPDLIGKPAPPVGAAAKVKLDSAELWDDYKKGDGSIPMWVNGTLDGIPVGSTIAVGVNGKIRGTTKSFDFKGAQRFGTLVDPASLVPGANQLTVYQVGPGNRLVPLGGN